MIIKSYYSQSIQPNPLANGNIATDSRTQWHHDQQLTPLSLDLASPLKLPFLRYSHQGIITQSNMPCFGMELPPLHLGGDGLLGAATVFTVEASITVQNGMAVTVVQLLFIALNIGSAMGNPRATIVDGCVLSRQIMTIVTGIDVGATALRQSS
jgi:hypothetical protein